MPSRRDRCDPDRHGQTAFDVRGQRKNPLFAQLVQALIEKSREEKQLEECAVLERLANHIRGLGATVQERLALPQT